MDRNVNISRMHNNQTESSVGINPTNPKNLVVVSNLDVGSGLFEGYTFDGGRTWTTKVIATGGGGLPSACCDPSLSFDRYGNLFFVYLDDIQFASDVALSTDGGVTFAKIAEVRPAGPSRSAPFRATGAAAGPRIGSGTDQPTITTGADSVWITYTASSGKIQASGAPVSGFGQVGAFTTPQSVAGTHGGGDYGDVAIGPDGQVTVIYQDQTGGEGPTNVWTALDRDGLGPQGFGQARKLTVSNVGGFDFIPAQSTRSVDAESALMYDRTGGLHDGRLYTMWTQELPNESNDMDIEFQYSDDDGVTWTSPVQLNDDTGTNSQFNPKIALDQSTGNLAACWYDARNDLGQGGPGDTDGRPNTDAQQWCTYSTDFGSTFVPNLQVSAATSNAKDANNGIDYGDYGALAFYGGRFFPVWADNSNATGDNPDGTLHQFDLVTTRVRVR
jgi:hypothetical protein